MAALRLDRVDFLRCCPLARFRGIVSGLILARTRPIIERIKDAAIFFVDFGLGKVMDLCLKNDDS